MSTEPSDEQIAKMIDAITLNAYATIYNLDAYDDAKKLARAVWALAANRSQHPEPVIDTCDHGHKFAKLPDHPLRDGKPRCPHCLAIGFDEARSQHPAERLTDAEKKEAAEAVHAEMGAPRFGRHPEPLELINDDDVFRLADVHAIDSRENGERVFDRGGLSAFAADIARHAATPIPVAAPAGWKWVPIEPTKDMVMAGGYLHPEQHFTSSNVYRAMLDASPAAPPSGEGQ